jgi:uncharacterized UBP type Zn finger protein
MRAIAECRHNGLPLLSDMPNVDLMITASLSNLEPPAAAEQRFAHQLQQMNNMGFTDNQRNLMALIASNGNLELATNWLSQH